MGNSTQRDVLPIITTTTITRTLQETPQCVLK